MFSIKQYPKHNGPESDRGFTVDEIIRNEHTLYQDVTCGTCGKVQALTNTGYFGGPCIKCGQSTLGKGKS